MNWFKFLKKKKKICKDINTLNKKFFGQIIVMNIMIITNYKLLLRTKYVGQSVRMIWVLERAEDVNAIFLAEQDWEVLIQPSQPNNVGVKLVKTKYWIMTLIHSCLFINLLCF